MERFYAIHNTPIFLGRQGENNARQVVFDLSGWLELYGESTVQLFARRSGEETMYPVPITREGSCAVWTVTEADVAVVGQTGECELSCIPDDGTLAKSEIWSTFVLPSMDGEVGEAPDAARAWIDALRRETAEQQKIAGAAAKSATEAAQSAGVSGTRASAAAKSAEAAEAAKRAITEMVVSAATLDEGVAATVSTELVDGVYRMLLGIPAGPRGYTGPQGVKGEPGDKGDTGPTGPQGPKGDMGLTGPQGEKGDTGSGFKVLDYYPSLSALQSAVRNPDVGDAYGVGAAEPYDIYIFGATSGWVNNGPLQGAKGDTGPAGPQGIPGETGATGATGPAGPEGPQGPKGDKGDQGAPGADGAKGDKGDKGDQGETGPAGADGAPAKINGVNTLTITTDEYLSTEQTGSTLKLGLKSAPSSMGAASYALMASGWAKDADDLYAQTIAVTGVTTDPEQVIVVDVQQTGTDIEADGEALAAWAGEEGSGPASQYVSQGSGSLTFHAKEAPTVNIPLNVAVGSV